MEFRVRLVHADAKQRVVRAQAFVGDRCVGSALGEASSAEEAEDRAMARLRRRLQTPRSPTPPSEVIPLDAAPPSMAASVHEEPPPAPLVNEEPLEPSGDPEDWSTDLLALDQLLRHLGWGREEERIFMQRLFGHPSRSKLTRYGDLMLLRRALENLPPGSQPDRAPLPPLRSDLLAQCDGLLVGLGWSTERARQCLEHHFAVTSRQHLSNEQLLAFNLLLEGELLGESQSD